MLVITKFLPYLPEEFEAIRARLLSLTDQEYEVWSDQIGLPVLRIKELVEKFCMRQTGYIQCVEGPT